MSKADQVEIECEADIAVISARVPVSGVRGMAYCLGNPDLSITDRLLGYMPPCPGYDNFNPP